MAGASHFGCRWRVTERFVDDHWFSQSRLQSQTRGFEEMSLRGSYVNKSEFDDKRKSQLVTYRLFNETSASNEPW